MSKGFILRKGCKTKDSLLKISNKPFCLLVVFFLALYLIPLSFAADEIKKPLQGHLQKKGKLNSPSDIKINNTKSNSPYNIASGDAKLNKPTKTKTSNTYSISQPYNPNNPPPIDNKIHPVSSNAH
jgi:hypothetical protein